MNKKTSPEVNVLLKKHMRSKVHGVFKYSTDKAHKANELVKGMKFQKIADAYKRSLSKKGTGKALKIKGETMPTLSPLNSRVSKNQANHHGMHQKESFKSFCILDIT